MSLYGFFLVENRIGSKIVGSFRALGPVIPFRASHGKRQVSGRP